MQSKLIIKEIAKEYREASAMFPPFNSAHEGYAVILEELDELKAEIWIHQSKRDYARMKKEAIQVAAMVLRFVIDVIPDDL